MRKTKPVVSVDVNGKGPSLGDFYGIFFEDINHAADGGLYAQMVQNPSFEFCGLDNKSYTPLTAWEIVGDADVRVRGVGSPFAKNPNYADIAAPCGGCGVRNLGFNGGMYFKKNEACKVSLFAKGAVKITVTLECGGEALASKELSLTDSWERYAFELSPSRETDKGSLGIYLNEGGRIGLDAVMVFPAETYKGGVLRKDLCEALEGLTPKFMRFPGGCLVHDGDLNPESRAACYCWKNTLGAPEARPARRSNWGYNQTLGLGYYEYFILCEQLGCEPLPVLPAGWNPHTGESCPLFEMKPWIDDALDLIEFANGGADTTWGKVRCELGHPKPFKLKYLAIGNEEVGVEFPPRFEIIANAVKEKYPKIKLIHSAGPFPSGSEYERGYAAARAVGADLIDEHYYASPRWLLANVDRYEKFPNKKPGVFLGEYASWGSKLSNAVAEAAYLTALENSARAVALTCYAPLLCNVDYKNWSPDLIYFDNKRLCKTANYYVQKMFSNNLGDYVLPVKSKGISAEAKEPATPISGEVEFVSDGGEGTVRDIRVINLDNGDTVSLGDFSFSAGDRHSLCDINLPRCELRFKYTKTGGGFKGLIINFGKSDENNRLFWEFGGWHNQDCAVSSRCDGFNACLDQHIFVVNTGYEYDMCLRIENRTVTTIVDGKVMNTCTDKIPEIKDLYVTASRIKKSGEVIIKAVNVNEKPFKAEIALGEGSWTGEVITLSGDKDAENTLEGEAVAPAAAPFECGAGFEMEFPPVSVRVIRIKPVL